MTTHAAPTTQKLNGNESHKEADQCEDIVLNYMLLPNRPHTLHTSITISTYYSYKAPVRTKAHCHYITWKRRTVSTFPAYYFTRPIRSEMATRHPYSVPHRIVVLDCIHILAGNRLNLKTTSTTTATDSAHGYRC